MNQPAAGCHGQCLPFSAGPHRTFPSCFCLLSVFLVCLSCSVDCKLWGQALLVFPLPTESSTIPSSKKLLSQCRMTEDAVFPGYLQTTHPLSWRKGTKFAVRCFSLWTQQPESRQMEKHIGFFCLKIFILFLCMCVCVCLPAYLSVYLCVHLCVSIHVSVGTCGGQ